MNVYIQDCYYSLVYESMVWRKGMVPFYYWWTSIVELLWLISAVFNDWKVKLFTQTTLIFKGYPYVTLKAQSCMKHSSGPCVVLQSSRCGGEAKQSCSVRIWGLSKWKCDARTRWWVFHVTSKRQGRRFVGILSTASLFMCRSERGSDALSEPLH